MKTSTLVSCSSNKKALKRTHSIVKVTTTSATILRSFHSYPPNGFALHVVMERYIGACFTFISQLCFGQNAYTKQKRIFPNKKSAPQK